MSENETSTQWNEARQGMRCDGCGRDLQRSERYLIDIPKQLRYGSLCGCGIRHEHPDFDLDAFLA